MRFPTFLVALTAIVLALAAAARADVRSVVIEPVEDRSLPFWCDWGYDWDERCYTDDGPRLFVGGVDDKVWRSALRFPVSLPPGALVTTAELSLRYDGTCVAPRRRVRACDGRPYDFTLHPIFTPRWLSEREVEIGPIVSFSSLEALAPPGWVVFDVTDLVADWAAGAPNAGVLVRLADGFEDYGAGGPAFTSMSYADPQLRPRLVVWYVLQ